MQRRANRFITRPNFRWRADTMVSRVIPVAPFDLVIFGATGDLARRKIIPGLFHRFVVGQIPPEARIIGAARTDMEQQAFIDLIRDSLAEFAPQATSDETRLAAFLETLRYVCVDASGETGWSALGGLLRADAVRAFYLSVSPCLERLPQI
jgi:glucose-6-phosphate 1-dehydrogenase